MNLFTHPVLASLGTLQATFQRQAHAAQSDIDAHRAVTPCLSRSTGAVTTGRRQQARDYLSLYPAGSGR